MEISVSHLSRTVFNRKRCYNEIFRSHIFTIPDVFKDVWFLWLLGTSENNDKMKKGNSVKKTIDIKIINNYNFFSFFLTEEAQDSKQLNWSTANLITMHW